MARLIAGGYGRHRSQWVMVAQNSFQHLNFNGSLYPFFVRQGGLMVSALVPGSSGPGLKPGWEHCVVFLGKTLNKWHSAPLHPGV